MWRRHETEIKDNLIYVAGIALSVSIHFSLACLRFMLMICAQMGSYICVCFGICLLIFTLNMHDF